MNRQELDNFLIAIPMVVGTIITFVGVAGMLIGVVLCLLFSTSIAVAKYGFAIVILGGLLILISLFVTYIQYLLAKRR